MTTDSPEITQWQRRCTLEAQRYTLVVIDGELIERVPWTPTDGMPAECHDCGAVDGQLHWPGCCVDYTADGRQILGEAMPDDYRTRAGDPFPGRPPFPGQ